MKSLEDCFQTALLALEVNVDQGTVNTLRNAWFGGASATLAILSENPFGAFLIAAEITRHADRQRTSGLTPTSVPMDV